MKVPNWPQILWREAILMFALTTVSAVGAVCYAAVSLWLLRSDSVLGVGAGAALLLLYGPYVLATMTLASRALHDVVRAAFGKAPVHFTPATIDRIAKLNVPRRTWFGRMMTVISPFFPTAIYLVRKAYSNAQAYRIWVQERTLEDVDGLFTEIARQGRVSKRAHHVRLGNVVAEVLASGGPSSGRPIARVQ